jgi:catechol 2,3-dioxygenase-like lactoylglutathione lyase family enzyme
MQRQENQLMITRLSVATIYVLDKEEALDFYVNKLGLEVGNDVRQGDYRWLTVRLPGSESTEISLEQPGAP